MRNHLAHRYFYTAHDPATDERIVLTESVRIEKPGNERSERAAAKEAEKVLTRLEGEADALKVARTKATLGALPDKWLMPGEVQWAAVRRAPQR